MNARVAARALLLFIAIGLPMRTAAQEALAGETLCGYSPHTLVELLDRNWDLYLPYPQADPFREIEFDSGFRVRRREYRPCATLIIAIGAGTIRWGDVTIVVAGNELTVNGLRVVFRDGANIGSRHSSVVIDSEGRVNENGVIMTVQ